MFDAPRRAVTTERMQGMPTETLNDLNLYEEDAATLITVLIEYPDKETRDAAFAEIMAAGDEMEMPFDGKRMIFGGFTPLLMEGDRT